MNADTDGDAASEEQVHVAVLAAYRAQREAMLQRRTDTLAALLADGYTAIHLSGYRQDKAEWLDQIDSGRMTYDAIEDESSVVEVKGETAVLTVRALVTAKIYGTYGTWPLLSITRYARRDGAWKPVHSRASTY